MYLNRSDKFRGVIRRQRPNSFYEPKKIAVEIGAPFTVSTRLPVKYCYFESFDVQPTNTGYRSLLTIFKIYHWYEATAKIYSQSPKSAP